MTNAVTDERTTHIPLEFDNVPTTKQFQDLIHAINHELDQGNLVRLVNDWDVPNGATIIYRIRPAGVLKNAVQTIEQMAALPHVLLYPGYLHLCKPGTPARVIAIEDCGGFGAQHFQQAYAYRLCMNHTYNEHDEDYDDTPLNYECNEDKYLDCSWEDKRTD